jgi:hypothetical protein
MFLGQMGGLANLGDVVAEQLPVDVREFPTLRDGPCQSRGLHAPGDAAAAAKCRYPTLIATIIHIIVAIMVG